MAPFREVWRLLRQTYNDWVEDKAPELGAALAFYTALSIAPLMVITLAIVAYFLGEEVASGQLVGQVRGLVGQDGGQTVEQMITSAEKPAQGAVASLLGFATLLFGASGVFGQLQSALNTIWEVQPKPGRGVWGFIRARFLSFAMGARRCLSFARFVVHHDRHRVADRAVAAAA